MFGVGVSASFSWTFRGVSARERCDWGVVGLSGDSERARSGVSVSSSTGEAQCSQIAVCHTCPPRKAFAAALYQLLFELFDALCVLLIPLV